MRSRPLVHCSCYHINSFQRTIRGETFAHDLCETHVAEEERAGVLLVYEHSDQACDVRHAGGGHLRAERHFLAVKEGAEEVVRAVRPGAQRDAQPVHHAGVEFFAAHARHALEKSLDSYREID